MRLRLRVVLAAAAAAVAAAAAGNSTMLDLFVWPNMAGSEFLRTYFEEVPVLVRQREGSPLAGVFSLNALDAVIEAGLNASHPAKYRLEVGKTLRLVKRLERDGAYFSAQPQGAAVPEAPDLAWVHSAFNAGFSVVLNALQLRDATVQRAALGLEAALGVRVNVNLYLTPPGAQAFEAHQDWMDGFIVQLTGRKAWRVYDRLVDRPRADLRYKPRQSQLGAAEEVHPLP
uniref:Bifunctional lysine-specific demethylase and histidyl-hydroxylase n=1 Tax=Phaeomonas parva TaxID=124430 RepID=A0A7S1U4K8_9STRA|mmetsp:Transcript_3080/g.8730  ORF Transcript_3080/g.8730 Transcript_3080/m.8730 type:complete len:229 (+) Transcript_3080:278-964(+)